MDKIGPLRRFPDGLQCANRGQRTPLAMLILFMQLLPRISIGSTIVVPDDSPNIQSAVNAIPDTVLIRGGVYDEDVVLFRGIAVLGYSIPDRPQVRRIQVKPIVDPTSTDTYTIRSLTVSNGLVFRNNLLAILVFIDRCYLPSGVADLSLQAETGTVVITNCTANGNIRVLVRGSLLLDSCYVSGHVSAGYGDAALTVWHSQIEGDGTGVGIASEGYPAINQASLYGNRLRGFERGIDIVAENNVYIRRNAIDGASAGGIMVGQSNEAYVDSNRIESCGSGVVMDGVTNGYVRENTILRSMVSGIRLEGERSAIAVVSGNLVASGGGNGIEILSGLGVGEVTNNTVAGNTGTGLVVAVTEDVEYGPFEVARNLAAFNQRYGIEWLTHSATTGACNDWFGNAMGNVWGREMGGEDFSIDPLFCDPSEYDYSVNSSSPLLSRDSCGIVGAFGAGCGETATLVRRFAARRIINGIEIVWEVAQGASASAIWIERSDESRQRWIRPETDRSVEGQTTVELDRSVLRSQSYTYRLLAQEGRDAVVLDPGVTVDPEDSFESRLGEIGPNPSNGSVRIVFSLKIAGPIDIGVYDMQGRRVNSLARGAWPAGRHTLGWDWLSSKGDPVPPGVYLLRYAYPGGQGTRELVRQ